jgi:hypothetical protein
VVAEHLQRGSRRQLEDQTGLVLPRFQARSLRSLAPYLRAISETILKPVLLCLLLQLAFFLEGFKFNYLFNSVSCLENSQVLSLLKRRSSRGQSCKVLRLHTFLRMSTEVFYSFLQRYWENQEQAFWKQSDSFCRWYLQFGGFFPSSCCSQWEMGSDVYWLKTEAKGSEIVNPELSEKMYREITKSDRQKNLNINQHSYRKKVRSTDLHLGRDKTYSREIDPLT